MGSGLHVSLEEYMTVTSPEFSKVEELNLEEWTTQNWRKLAIGGGIAVVVALVVFLFVWSGRRKEAFAAQELMQARNTAEAGNLPLASSDLTRLIDRFGGTHSADEAMILLTQIRLVQNQRDLAVTGLQEFVRSRHDHSVQASAYALLGAGLEDQGKPRDAGEAYRQASNHADRDFLKAQYLLDAGRSYAVARDSAAAKNAYGEVLERFPRLDQAAEARVRMAELGGTVPPPPPPEDSTD
jgi:predicted negative regulator of RcsB-dependent stress response